jgi:putative flippase GtrA
LKIINTTISQKELRYLIFGVWNTIFGIIVFVSFYNILKNEVHYLAILLLAQSVGVIQSHYTQRRFVWKSNNNYAQELFKFSSVYLFATILNSLMLAALVENNYLDVIPAQLLCALVIIVVMYFAQKKCTFR